MKFEVNIEGEAGHPHNIARALARLSEELDQLSAVDPPTKPLDGVVRDVHGTVIGTWRFDPTA